MTKKERIAEWRANVFKPCKQKMETQDSSVWNVYCRRTGREGPSCLFENCPLVDKKERRKYVS